MPWLPDAPPSSDQHLVPFSSGDCEGHSCRVSEPVHLSLVTVSDPRRSTQRILHSVFSVRVLLNLREAHHRDVGDDRSTGVSSSCSSLVIFAPLAVSPA